jgi:hypothetical protein
MQMSHQARYGRLSTLMPAPDPIYFVVLVSRFEYFGA